MLTAEMSCKVAVLLALLLYEGVQSCGGLAPSAVQLIQDMAQVAAEHLSLWSRIAILRELLGSVAIAVQRGSAMSYLEGYDRSLSVMSRRDMAGIAVAAESDGEE